MCGSDAKQALKCWGAALLLGAIATLHPAWLALDATLAGNGEWWRLLTGHLVHLTWRHYLLDELALGLAVCLCLALNTRLPCIAGISLLSAASVSLMLMTTRPVDVYGGLSGITAGLVAYAALRMAGGNAPLTGITLLAAMAAKIVSEQAGISASAIPTLWQAHCAGALAGFAWALPRQIQERLGQKELEFG